MYSVSVHTGDSEIDLSHLRCDSVW
uniref:Uncharacterized protein n=1 Tax=Anguilla anguilla TaxID=7936 RepID=A0A0E9VIW4_ANGAN